MTNNMQQIVKLPISSKGCGTTLFLVGPPRQGAGVGVGMLRCGLKNLTERPIINRE